MHNAGPSRRRPIDIGPESDRAMIEKYVSELRRRTQAYEMPASEARRVVDESMGSIRLTDLLYKSRDEDVM
jgi:hypothetical protein